MRARVAILVAVAAASAGGCDHTGDGAPAQRLVLLGPAGDRPRRVGLRCGPGVPREACRKTRRALRGTPGAGEGARLTVCRRGEVGRRVGAWDYALVAPKGTPTRRLGAASLRRSWHGEGGFRLQLSGDTRAVFASRWGPPRRPLLIAPAARELVPQGSLWSLVPAHRLRPYGVLIRVAETLPFDLPAAAAHSLRIPLCLRGAPPPPRRIDNVDPAALTRLVMTGGTYLAGDASMPLERRGAAFVDAIAPFFRGADLVHVSHDAPFVRFCQPWPQAGRLCAKPRYAAVLRALNTAIVQLSGNHLLDYGARPMLETVALIEKNGWRFFGGGRTQIAAAAALRLTHHGNRLAFVGCNVPLGDQRRIRRGASVAYCDLPRIRRQIQDLRREGYLPIVAIHHRDRGDQGPGPRMVGELRELAAAGAAVVFGSQQRAAQPWERHFGAFIHYGAGDLFAPSTGARRGAVVDRLFFHRGRLLGVEQRFTAVREGEPRWMDRRRRAALLAAVARRAEHIRTPPTPAGRPRIPARGDRQRPDSFLSVERPLPLLVYDPRPERQPRPANGRWPLILFLHGANERGRDLAVVRRHGPPRYVDAHREPMPFFLASPQEPPHQEWSLQDIMAARRHMLAKYPIDIDRIYLTGFSLGALGVWRAAQRRPRVWAAIAPVAGFPLPKPTCALRAPPTWVFHGDRDHLVPARTAQQMVDLARRCGNREVKLTRYPGAGHEEARRRAYGDPMLYRWLLSHRRRGRGRGAPGDGE